MLAARVMAWGMARSYTLIRDFGSIDVSRFTA